MQKSTPGACRYRPWPLWLSSTSRTLWAIAEAKRPLLEEPTSLETSAPTSEYTHLLYPEVRGCQSTFKRQNKQVVLQKRLDLLRQKQQNRSMAP